ncbi:hypothetical protein ACH5RR_021493 [Cinchona calisaya]|uniref:Uncharacterized protein n=1 Tax=Cinchona calisaya TaxID=153742 RepID=A0ABD2ZID0_9GENT
MKGQSYESKASAEEAAYEVVGCEESAKRELSSDFRPGSVSSVRPKRQASRLSAVKLILSTIDNTCVRQWEFCHIPTARVSCWWLRTLMLSPTLGTYYSPKWRRVDIEVQPVQLISKSQPILDALSNLVLPDQSHSVYSLLAKEIGWDGGLALLRIPVCPREKKAWRGFMQNGSIGLSFPDLLLKERKGIRNPVRPDGFVFPNFSRPLTSFHSSSVTSF